MHSSPKKGGISDMMKKMTALLLLLLTMMTAGGALAEAPFEGVWVQYEAGWIQWLMPSDWLEMEVTEEMMEANLFYGAFAPDGSKTLQILWTPLTQPKTIEDIQSQLAPSYDNVELLDVNGKKMVYFADTLNNMFGYAMLDELDPGVYQFFFSPVDEAFEPTARAIAASVRSMDEQ